MNEIELKKIFFSL